MNTNSQDNINTGWSDWSPELQSAAAQLLDMALAEDLGSGDVTARYFGGAGNDAPLVTRLVAREPGVIAGIPLFLRTFETVAERCGQPGSVRILTTVADGHQATISETLARVEAPAMVMHGAERTALNFLQRLCGVATITAAAVALSCGPRILDTRKTTPGYRLLEKYAVRMGGGDNHRLGLFDTAMVKDNHKDALGGIPAVMERAGDLPADIPLIIEVDNLSELEQVFSHANCNRVMRVLLDNFSHDDVRTAIELRRRMEGEPEFEVSGGLTATDLGQSAYADVETASLGSLTHSVRAMDLALEVETR
ncbi:MAG: carboxylating nicotinate-nucleotide diphosphorylase [bacterium]|nr:carboxylating nicotinate-nucleotide diphosphorylase [bacterium]